MLFLVTNIYIILLITLVSSVLASLRYLKKGRFLEVFIILATYFLPLSAIIKVKNLLTSFLKDLLQRNASAVEAIDGIVVIILSPVLFFWIVLLFFGGFALLEDIDLIHYLKSHIRKKYIKSKLVGFSLVILGLLLGLLSLIYIDLGIWQTSFLSISLFAYFIGAFFIVIPKESESMINKIIYKIKN